MSVGRYTVIVIILWKKWSVPEASSDPIASVRRCTGLSSGNAVRFRGIGRIDTIRIPVSRDKFVMHLQTPSQC